MMYSKVNRIFGRSAIREIEFFVQQYAPGRTWRMREFRRDIANAIVV